ncbi:MAG: phosphoglycerate-specific signal transduction histidine kinase, partial [Ascidiaceihabitans sp.]
RQDLCIILHRRIAPCEVLAGFDTCHNTPPFKSRHHPNSVITHNGPGFPDTDAALIPFHTTKADQNGLGLGLSISADIMKGFAGTLTLAETSGGGACVVLQFEPAAAMAKL